MQRSPCSAGQCSAAAPTLQQVLLAGEAGLERPPARLLHLRPQQLQLPPQLGAALHQAAVLRLRLGQRRLQLRGALALALQLALRRALLRLRLRQPRLQLRQLLPLPLQLLQQRALAGAAEAGGAAAGRQLVDGALARQQRVLQLRDGAVLGVQRRLPVGARLLGAALRLRRGRVGRVRRVRRVLEARALPGRRRSQPGQGRPAIAHHELHVLLPELQQLHLLVVERRAQPEHLRGAGARARGEMPSPSLGAGCRSRAGGSSSCAGVHLIPIARHPHPRRGAVVVARAHPRRSKRSAPPRCSSRGSHRPGWMLRFFLYCDHAAGSSLHRASVLLAAAVLDWRSTDRRLAAAAVVRDGARWARPLACS